MRTVVPDGRGRLRRNNQAGVEHLVDLPQVACQGFLIDDFENIHEPVATEHREAVLDVAMKEKVTREQGHDRPDLAPWGVRLSLTA